MMVLVVLLLPFIQLNRGRRHFGERATPSGPDGRALSKAPGCSRRGPAKSSTSPTCRTSAIASNARTAAASLTRLLHLLGLLGGGELIVERNKLTGLECMVQRRKAWKLKEITKVLVRAGMTWMIAMRSILQLGSRRKSLPSERGGSTRHRRSIPKRWIKRFPGALVRGGFTRLSGV